MAQPTSKASRTPTAAMERAPLPPSRAFVVQMRADAAPTDGTFTGRVEHMTSGAAARFETVTQLVEFIRTVIDDA